MNEELRIIIRAVTDEARRNIAAVREELENVQDTSSESGKAVDTAMKGFAKGAAMAMAAVTALTAAMTALGKSAQEVQKGFDKLNTTFLNAGSTTAKASNTYKELFSFLGEHDKAIETAQSLALITTEEEKLAQWTNILQGAFAEMGDKLPIEGLAEAANETINTGVVTGVFTDALNWAKVSEDGFNEALAQTSSLSEREALVRSTLNGLYSNSAKLYEQNSQATLRYNESQANLNITLAQASGYTTPLLTALNELSTSLLTFFAPALQTVATYLTAFIQLMAEAIVWVGNFFGLFSESSETAAADVDGYRKAVEDYQNSLRNAFSGSNSEMDENLDKINKLKKATMGFDELNIVSSQSASSSGGGSGAGVGAGKLPAAPNPSDFGLGGGSMDFSVMTEGIKEAKEEIKGILTLVGLIGAGILAWKFVSILPTLKEAVGWILKYNGNMATLVATEKFLGGEAINMAIKLQKIGGILLIVAGTMLAIKGYTDAWVNGANIENITAMITGAGIAALGAYLAFGTLGAGIVALAAGLALMVVGVKDFIKNGPTLANTFLIIGGAIAVAIGLATAGLSVLLSAIIAAAVAVVAFTAAILLEEPAIMSVDEAQKLHAETIEALMNAEMNYANVMDKAEAAMKRLEDAEKAAGMSGKDLYNQVSNGTLTYGELTDAQKELYKAYIDNEQKQKEVEEATKSLKEAKDAERKAAWESQLALAKESESYDEFKKSVVAAFEAGELSADEAREQIGKSMSEMSTDAQQTFMQDLPSSIKEGLNPNKYETTRKKMGDWFKAAGKWFIESIWQPVKDFWNKYIAPIFTKQWWSNKFNAIKDGAKAGLNGVISAVESAINGIIKKINTLSWKIPDWVPVFGGDTFGFNMKLVSIPRLATGGIVTQSTLANIGERGKEAVLPLENNTGWMDTLADRIASRNNTPTRVVLAVDGRELGYATINSINGITAQTGKLQLSLY